MQESQAYCERNAAVDRRRRPSRLMWQRFDPQCPLTARSPASARIGPGISTAPRWHGAHMPGFAHRRHSRRAFLGQSFGLVVGVAGGSLWTGWGARGAAAYFAADGGAPMAFLSTDTVSQGEAFSLHVNSRYATGGMATFNGRQYALYSDAGSGYLIAILGAGQLATDEIEIDPGDYTVQVATLNGAATPGSVELGISVTPTNFPVDEVDLPPQTAALLAPTLVNAEYQILQTQYTPQIDHRLWQGLFQWPVVGPITTNFGEARSYNG